MASVKSYYFIKSNCYAVSRTQSKALINFFLILIVALGSRQGRSFLGRFFAQIGLLEQVKEDDACTRDQHCVGYESYPHPETLACKGRALPGHPVSKVMGHLGLVKAGDKGRHGKKDHTNSDRQHPKYHLS